MFNKARHHDSWYRMDNSAIIYPFSMTTTTQSLFRLGAELKEDIDEEVLELSLNEILERFPSFKVQLRSGFFKHFFDHNENRAVVSPDNGILFQKINFITNNYFLFRVTYFKNKLWIDFFHALCDGSGALEFLKALIFQYLRRLNPDITNDGSVKEVGDIYDTNLELENSFDKYHTDYKLFGGVIGKMAGKNAYQIRGKMFSRLGYGLIEGYIDTPSLKAVAKKYNCSITALIVANALLSVLQSGKTREKEQLVAVIPVDLRRHFESKTLLNFTSIVRVVIDPVSAKSSLEAYTKLVSEQLSKEINQKDLREKLSLSSFMSKNPFLKVVPLFIKGFFIRLAKKLNFKTRQTLIISNLAVVKMPDDCKNHVERVFFNNNVSTKAPKNIGIVSYNDKTVISFTRKVISTEAERIFFKRFAEEGIEVDVVSNLR